MVQGLQSQRNLENGAASLWSIWLSGNEEVFRRIKRKEKLICNLIKLRSREWALATDLIIPEILNWWKSNPSGAVMGCISFGEKSC